MTRRFVTVAALTAVLGVSWLGPAAAGAQTATDARCVLAVDGMFCAGCAVAVKLAARRIDGVKDVTVNYDTRRAEVTYDPKKTTPAAIAKGITERSGFKTTLLSAPKR